ncbi:MAG: 16S rRNA (cytosine(1402)-N(4))-methyltransferase RsmH [Oscillospiraceae bacterium]|nr:16S rRNA (cytosine(1402)-N(4))-methyltransferase RsmH [Oscillospiraceae bacterium]
MEHRSVLLQECVKYLNIRPDGVYVDGTLGLGGHSEAILERLTTGKLLGIDRDSMALDHARRRLARFGERAVLVKGSFGDLGAIMDSQGIARADGMLFDLGVSSPQLDNAERGFSYMHDAPLDMRMDQSMPLTAGDILNTWPETELRSIFWRYGEERYAGRIAAAVVERRERKPIETTGEFAALIRDTMPASARRERQHPAKRCFQAVRIAVNDELGELERMLEQTEERLAPGGRLLVISFQSLEDRLVKEAIRKRENGCTCPRDFPVCTCGFVQTFKSVTRKPVVPTAAETEENPRARSARLRIAEKV